MSNSEDIRDVYEVLYAHLLSQGIDETTAERAAMEEAATIKERALMRARIMIEHGKS